MLKTKLIVEDDISLRVDKYIVSVYDELSRSELKYYFDEGLVQVNEKIVKPSFVVTNNDIIDIFERKEYVIDLEKEDIPLDIVYEDNDIIVVNKPSGLVVHPGAGHLNHTLVNGLLYHCNNLSNIGGDTRAGIVHRIDKDTSGLLVACKNNQAHRILANEFKEKTSTKRIYYAIVSGIIDHNLGKINAPIGRDKTNRQKMCVCEDGKDSITNFKVLERLKGYTLVECQLETGRTHQIRVHMAYIGHPVLNDPLYGVSKQTTEFGQYLHAKTLGFIHPITNKEMFFDSELPDEFKNMLDKLRS